ncbi:MAG TPA: efflux RND transporter periplasmic adaptor subunit [Burkholderiaceae bacterium]|nr:efflux RND transporter periplasmic adaptor subunit [Burkholderiaceae bacterium]
MKPVTRGVLAAGVAAVVMGAVGAYWGVGRATPPQGAQAAERSAAAPGTAASSPPVSVSIVRVQKRDVPVQLDATGTVAALHSVDVRPQVGGVITKVHIREGQFVQAGQLLFTLDARTAQASLSQAQASLQKDQAALADAQRQLARSRELLAQGFVTQGAVDTSQAQVDAQAAAVSAARAAIDAARVSLGYCRITAPSGGRAGAIVPVAGSTVQAGTTTLVTLTQLDPIAVGFNLPQRNLADALELLRSGGGTVTARLPERGKPLTGRLQFVDNLVDAASGTVKVKAVFDNKDQALWPGAFVDVRLVVQTLKDALVVPQAAVIPNERGKTVYVVEAGNKAQPRRVEVVHAAGLEAVVTGLQPGDRVVVDGRQNLRPGSVVVERSVAGPRQAGAASAPGPSASAASVASEP